MPTINPVHLFDRAQTSMATGRQTDLRRGVSDVYYGLFHAALGAAADLIVGKSAVARKSFMYGAVYRQASHTELKKICENLKTFQTSVAGGFGDEMEAFAIAIVELQRQRHLADYDPLWRATRSDLVAAIDAARTAYQKFVEAPAAEREAFLLLLYFKPRKSD